MVIIAGEERKIPRQEGKEPFLLREAVKIFLLGLNVGIVVENGDAEMVCQPFQDGAGAGTAAAVEQQGRAAAFQPSDLCFHFQLVISLLHRFQLPV
jgi:hypothetical protein